MKIESYRDQEWLENLLSEIWLRHFIDVDQPNEVRIKYGRKAKQRLGSISLDKNNPEITIPKLCQGFGINERTYFRRKL